MSIGSVKLTSIITPVDITQDYHIKYYLLPSIDTPGVITKYYYTRGDLLKSVPCVSAWHKKKYSQIFILSQNLLYNLQGTCQLYKKNIRANLPDLHASNTTGGHFRGCHALTFFRNLYLEQGFVLKMLKYHSNDSYHINHWHPLCYPPWHALISKMSRTDSLKCHALTLLKNN